MKQGPLFRFFHRLLAPPIFEDAEETHRARIQNAFLLATLLITFVFALIVVPSSPAWRPSRDFLAWHNERRFVG